jgi:predicted RNase H-like HicB family nuclease
MPRVKKSRKEYSAYFLDRGKWWVAWTDDVPGALTQGRTLREARENLRDAIALMLEPVDDGSLPARSKCLVHEVLVL